MSIGKVIVAGASAGIGLAVSVRLAAAGYHVTGLARRFSQSDAGAPFARTISVDLSRIDELDAFARNLCAKEGEVDALILCAGVGRFAPVESMSVADMRYMMDLNLLAPMILSRAFVPSFKTRRRGDFVFIGSEAAHLGGARGSAYCASKFGLRGFVKSLRIECASRGVRVCLINPGMTDTDFYEGQGFAPGKEAHQHLRADDSAAAVEMVLSAPRGTVFDEINLTPATRVIDFSSARDDG